MSGSLDFSFHGVTLTIDGETPPAREVMRRLAEDFAFFKSAPSSRAQIVMTLRTDAAPSPGRLRLPLFQTRMCRVWRAWRGRFCDYGSGTATWARWIRDTRCFDLYANSVDELYEVTYGAVLSAVGEALDRRGYHRVHALGLESGGRAALVVLPQGGGKSALATLLSRRGGMSFFSDEIPLLRRGRVHAFPIRLALRPEVAEALRVPLSTARLFKRRIFPAKLLFSLPPERIAASNAPLGVILLGRKTAGGVPAIRPVRRVRALVELTKAMVIGLGVPQMSEHMLRPSPVLAKILISRLWTAFVAARTPVFLFDVSEDAHVNADVLFSFLARRLSRD